MPRGDYNLTIDPGGTGKSSWHVGEGEIKWFPQKTQQFSDLSEIASNYVFNGPFYPKEPVFESSDRIIAIGSCFAQRLRDWLRKNGKEAEYILVPSGLNNSFAVRQYVEWCLTGERSEDAYWYDSSESVWESKEEQSTILEVFKRTPGIVFTFGLAEVWRDKVTRGVFWRGVPERKFNKDIHECVLSSVEENLSNMKRIYDAIMKYAGERKTIIYTLSPVPLNATYLDRPAIVSDCVSKSTLRIALDEFFKLKLPNVYYWPSFEMFRWVGAHTWKALLTKDDDARGTDLEIVGLVLENFVKRYFK